MSIISSGSIDGTLYQSGWQANGGGPKNLLLLGTEKIERGGGVSRTDHKHADIPALLCNRVQVGQHLYVYTRRGNRFFLFHLFFLKDFKPNLSSKRKEKEKKKLSQLDFSRVLAFVVAAAPVLFKK
jgi:hypothetical protein